MRRGRQDWRLPTWAPAVTAGVAAAVALGVFVALMQWDLLAAAGIAVATLIVLYGLGWFVAGVVEHNRKVAHFLRLRDLEIHADRLGAGR